MTTKLWMLAALVAVSLIALLFRNTGYDSRSNTIPISGNIEITEVRVSFRMPGRLLARLVDEGASVTKGDVVARLDTEEMHQEVALRTAEKAVAEAMLQEIKNGALPEEIAQLQAKRDQAQADFDRQQAEYTRQKQLVDQDVISKREFDASRAAFEVAQSRLEEASKALSLIQKGTREEKIAQAEARLQQVTEALAIAQTRLGYGELEAPISGSVLSKSAEPGEFVQAGMPIITIGDLSDVWLRAFISETDLGRVKLGDKVLIHTDTYPDKPYEGRVTFISSEAEFTPKNIQTAQERVKLVYRIKVQINNPNQELKPGMPADAVILVNQNQAK